MALEEGRWGGGGREMECCGWENETSCGGDFVAAAGEEARLHRSAIRHSLVGIYLLAAVRGMQLQQQRQPSQQPHTC